MPPASNHRRTVEGAFDGDLGAYVAARYAEGVGWRGVSTALADQHGLYVSHETLRVWYGDRITTPATPPVHIGEAS